MPRKYTKRAKVSEKIVDPHKVETVTPEMPADIEEEATSIKGLEQTFKTADGKVMSLKDLLIEGDWWTLKKGKSIATIITHAAVKKIANTAGVSKVIKYDVLTQPEIQNNYMYVIQATVFLKHDPEEAATGIGETNRQNLGLRGRNNPGNMTEKRAYDRAVFNLLELSGLLSEDELPDSNEEKREMENLTPEQAQLIAPEVNMILAIQKEDPKAQTLLKAFNADMKKKLAKYEPVQLDYLRALYRKKSAELTNTF